MTREEAINYLERSMAIGEDDGSRHHNEVLEFTIKALEQEPCEDAVSRKAVLEIIEREEFKGDALSEIEKLPSVTPTPKWIPVSERMPKEGETVLVCYRTQEGVAQSACEWFDMPNRGIVWSTLCGSTPIAWMPLPEPYKAEMECE